MRLCAHHIPAICCHSLCHFQRSSLFTALPLQFHSSDLRFCRFPHARGWNVYFWALLFTSGLPVQKYFYCHTEVFSHTCRCKATCHSFSPIVKDAFTFFLEDDTHWDMKVMNFFFLFFYLGKPTSSCRSQVFFGHWGSLTQIKLSALLSLAYPGGNWFSHTLSVTHTHTQARRETAWAVRVYKWPKVKNQKYKGPSEKFFLWQRTSVSDCVLTETQLHLSNLSASHCQLASTGALSEKYSGGEKKRLLPPNAFVMHCIALRISQSPNAVYFSTATNTDPHTAGSCKDQASE